MIVRPTDQPIHLEFSDLVYPWADRRLGSREHYFHFMLGCLMPALHIARSSDPDQDFRLPSCGPVLDPVTLQACALLDLSNLHICGKAPPPGALRMSLPRWDTWFLENEEYDARFRQSIAPSPVGPLDTLRSAFLRALGRTEDAVVDPFQTAVSWTLLERSPQPDFYADGGPAEKPGYGAGRRAIANSDALLSGLQAAGLNVTRYEPGRQSLESQILRFHDADGIVGIRGAEFVNILWMRPASRALMIMPPGRANHGSRNLAALRRVRFATHDVDTHFPQLAPSDLLPSMRRLA